MHVHLVWTSPLLSTVTSHKLWWSKDQYKNQYSILEEKSLSLSVVVAWAQVILSLCGSSLSSPSSLSYLCDKTVRSLFYSLLWLSFPFCIQSPFGHRGKKSNKLRCINCICTIQHHVTKEFIVIALFTVTNFWEDSPLSLSLQHCSSYTEHILLNSY